MADNDLLETLILNLDNKIDALKDEIVKHNTEMNIELLKQTARIDDILRRHENMDDKNQETEASLVLLAQRLEKTEKPVQAALTAGMIAAKLLALMSLVSGIIYTLVKIKYKV
jgi:hypothetical protein